MPYKDKYKHKVYQAGWYAKRREDWLAKNGPCAICGMPEGLRAHYTKLASHPRPRPRNFWSVSTKRLGIILKDFIVLCGPCSVENTLRQKKHGVYRGHGLIKTYGSGCRCALCKRAKRDDMREWRARHPGYRRKQEALNG